MRSLGHRKNILTQYFQKEGIGVVISPDVDILPGLTDGDSRIRLSYY